MTPDPKIINLKAKEYRIFIAGKECINAGPGCGGDVVAHHESALGHKGMGTKVSDLCCVPLCVECHRIRHANGPRLFWGDDLTWVAKRCISFINEFLSEEF